MLSSIRRRIAAAGLAVSSLLPSASKVSFMGAKDTPRAIIVAVEEAAVKAEPAVEAAVKSGAKPGVGTAVTVGGATLAGGGLIAERGCVKAGTTLLSDGAKAVETGVPRSIGGAVETAETSIPRLGIPSAEVPVFPKSPFVRPPILAVPPVNLEPLAPAARAGLKTAGFSVTSAHSAETLAVETLLRRDSMLMTQQLVAKLNVSQLTSPEEVAKAFETGFQHLKGVHTTFDAYTGVVSLHAERNGLVVMAEFNAYKAASGAAAAIAIAPQLMRPGQRPEA